MKTTITNACLQSSTSRERRNKSMSMAKPVVLLFQDDYKRVKDWVLQYPDSETGGQMFGLWTHDRNPHINVITGPGKNCRHGSHSFHQDIEYLKNVGSYLNSEFMMCHIGEWHSHHRLRLRQPSSGDLNSIWKHFPAGLDYFLLIIATIEDEDVRLNPWLFTASTRSHQLIEVKFISKNNVFMHDEALVNTISSGAEIYKQNPQTESPSAPSTEKNGERGPVKKRSKTKSGEKWYHTDWGIRFAQLLHSKLEKSIIDHSTTIDKTVEKEHTCLQFSFKRNTRHVILTFPADFPDSGLFVQYYVPGSSSPSRWYQSKNSGQDDEKLVDQIVRDLKDTFPRVPKSTSEQCAAAVK